LTESLAFLTNTYSFTAYVVDTIYNITNSSNSITYFDVTVSATSDAYAYIKFSTKIANYASITLNDTVIKLRIIGNAQFEDDN
jgi:hypothetical protein